MVNEENLKYLEKHGFSFSSSFKNMIKEANRDEGKELAEKLLKEYFH